MLPEYEEREAALFGLYNWAEWLRLPREERVDGVAHYRLHNLIQSHLQATGEAWARQQSRARSQR